MEKIKEFVFQSDAGIIERIIGGEMVLFEILIRRHNAVLYKIARSFGFNHQDAEDLMQETHVAAYLQLKKFEKRSSYRTWLSRIMVNKCLYKMKIGYFKNERPSSTSIDEESKPLLTTETPLTTDEISKKELSRIIEYALERIPVMYRTVFMLREVEGFNVSETSELLNITPVNVKVRLSRARALLQKELEQAYTSAELYEFHLRYCDGIVKRVFDQIMKSNF
jgi:RNA polymerase sigma-70 factor (ECF subfamily)